MEKAVKPSFDDQIFEDRNKEFGAYFLRQIYSDHVMQSFWICLITASLALSSPVIYNKFFHTEGEREVLQEVEINLEKVEIEEPVEPPPPPIEVPPPQVATVKFLPPEIKPDDQVKQEETPTADDLEKATAGNVTREGTVGENQAAEEAAKPEPAPEVQEVLAYVPVQAEFEGGNEALIRFLGTNIVYPDEAQKKGITGDVWVQFTVNLDGSISDAKIFKGIGYGCDEEAQRAIMKLPAKWTPGKVNGEPKRSKKKVKIHFGF